MTYHNWGYLQSELRKLNNNPLFLTSSKVNLAWYWHFAYFTQQNNCIIYFHREGPTSGAQTLFKDPIRKSFFKLLFFMTSYWVLALVSFFLLPPSASSSSSSSQVYLPPLLLFLQLFVFPLFNHLYPASRHHLQNIRIEAALRQTWGKHPA